MRAPVFLGAEWRHLAMLNYAIDPETLRPFVPRGTELDSFDGRTFVSVVGFQFLRTRVCGVSIPLHADFDEVNLRFYVRRKEGAEWRRGVVFIREIVPQRAIAFLARCLYGERYLALPMQSKVERLADGIRVRYAWRHEGRWNAIEAAAPGEPERVESGTEEEFIAEHYWGYTARGAGAAGYEVEHPRWRVWKAAIASLDCDTPALYGDAFTEALAAPPSSAFIAEGSPVKVRFGAALALAA